MGKVSMLTVIPANLVEELRQNRSVHEYNTMPQISRKILDAVRDFMSRKVGYSELPMACFGMPDDRTQSGSVENILTYLPVNNKDDVLFQLDMPNDMIVSVNFNTILEASNDANACLDDEELEFVLEEFSDELHLGLSDRSSKDIIFIPFLDADRCRFYARFNDRFDTEELDLPGIAKMDIRKLTSFM